MSESIGYSIPGTRVVDMVPAKGGEAYRIFLSVPTSVPPEQGWPLLVLTDGNASFPFAAASMRVQAPYPTGTNVGTGVIAAIGYPSDAPYDALRRSWDLGPPPGKTYPPFSPDGPPVVTGGAGELFDFIENELIPELEKLTSIDHSKRSFFGHSFGGLCALHGVFTRPDLFENWIAASPSIYWDDEAILKCEAERKMVSGKSCFLHLSAGEYEGQALAPFQTGQPDAAKRLEKKKTTRTVSNAQDMAVRLNQPPDNLRADFELFAAETHMSVLAVAVHRAVAIAFAINGTGLQAG